MKLTRTACAAVYLSIAIPVCLLFIWDIDVNSMEGIIALGGRHMLDTGEWFVPKLYGEIYAYKPAMAYWLAAVPDYLFDGHTELTLRLPTALCGIVLGLMLCRTLGTLITPRCGLFAALAATVSVLFIEQVRSASFELPLALGTGVAILVACRNVAVERPGLLSWVIGYAGLCFGFLAKGMPAVAVYAPGLVVAGLVLRRARELLHWRHLVGVAVFASGASVYLYLAYRAEGSAAFADQAGELATRSAKWTLGSVGKTLLKPFVIFAAFLPFSAILIIGRLRKERPALPEPAQRIAAAAWAFLLTAIVVFMAASIDNTRYYLPLVVPVAVLCGLTAESISPTPCRSNEPSVSEAARTPRTRGELALRRAPVVLTVIGLGYWAVYAGVVQPHRAVKRSERQVAEAFDPHIPKVATVYLDTGDSHSSLCFYLDREIRIWRVFDPHPAGPRFVILEQHQVNGLATRSEVDFKVLTTVRGPRKRIYTLGVVEPAEAPNPPPG
ncbi:MAG: phospholipid carrier-dependent glycosyltransferase [bacterium]|nr:phospholipid carrier-dependent glycosyltransferase [bacterium]